LHSGLFLIDGVQVTRENLAAALVDARPAREDDDA
jgi:hypothetical protein